MQQFDPRTRLPGARKQSKTHPPLAFKTHTCPAPVDLPATLFYTFLIVFLFNFFKRTDIIPSRHHSPHVDCYWSLHPADILISAQIRNQTKTLLPDILQQQNYSSVLNWVLPRYCLIQSQERYLDPPVVCSNTHAISEQLKTPDLLFYTRNSTPHVGNPHRRSSWEDKLCMWQG